MPLTDHLPSSGVRQATLSTQAIFSPCRFSIASANVPASSKESWVPVFSRADPRRHKDGQEVADHRLVVDGLLVAHCLGNRVEAGSRAACQDALPYSAHLDSSSHSIIYSFYPFRQQKNSTWLQGDHDQWKKQREDRCFHTIGHLDPRRKYTIRLQLRSTPCRRGTIHTAPRISFPVSQKKVALISWIGEM